MWESMNHATRIRIAQIKVRTRIVQIKVKVGSCLRQGGWRVGQAWGRVGGNTKLLVLRNNSRTGEWRSRRYEGGQGKGSSAGTAKGERGRMANARTRRKVRTNGV